MEEISGSDAIPVDVDGNNVDLSSYYTYGIVDHGVGDLYYYDYVEEVISQHMTSYLSPILLFIGVIGNVISFFILLGLGYKKLSSCMYLAVLAIFDSVHLFIKCGNIWMINTFHFNINNKISLLSNVACQVFSFLSSIISMSNWLLVAILLEMCHVSFHPERAHRICQRERAKNVILVVMLFLVCVNAHFFWTYGNVPMYMGIGNKMIMCTFTPSGSYYSEYFRDEVWPIMESLVSCYFPLVCTITFVIIICKNTGFCHDKKAATLNANHFVLDAQALQAFRQITVVLGIYCVIFTLPEACYNQYEYFYFEKSNIGATDGGGDTYLHSIAQRALVRTVTSLCSDLFRSTKPIIYCLLCKQFRRRFMKIVFFKYCRCCRRRCRQSVPNVDNAAGQDDREINDDNLSYRRERLIHEQVVDNRTISANLINAADVSECNHIPNATSGQARKVVTNV